MDSTAALFRSPMATGSRRKSMTVRTFDLVAREGIEPPTPAFSGLLIDNAKWFRISVGDSWRKSYVRSLLVLIGMI